MNSIFIRFLALCFFMSTVTNAQTSVSRPLTLAQAEASVASMSTVEMQAALTELNMVMASLQEDLKSAKQQDDGRKVVKIRDGALTAGGAALGALVLLGAMNGVSSMLKKSGPYEIFGSEKIFALSSVVGIAALVIAPIGIAIGAVSAGIVYLSPSEASKISKKISEIQTRIQQIQNRLVAANASAAG